MPFELLDLILAGIMLISGLLALMRGFTREALSLVAWGGAAVAAYFAIKSPDLLAYAKQFEFLNSDIVAKVAVGASAFLVVLIIISLISVKISDLVVDSAAGAFDRTLGFIYGLARGLVLVVIAYLFYGWLIPVDRQETWVKNARSLPVIQSVGQIILSLVPPDIAETLNDALGTQQGGATSITVQPDSEKPASPDDEGYKKNESQGLDQLIQGTQGQSQGTQGQSQDTQKPSGGNPQQPAFGGESNPN